MLGVSSHRFILHTKKRKISTQKKNISPGIFTQKPPWLICYWLVMYCWLLLTMSRGNVRAVSNGHTCHCHWILSWSCELSHVKCWRLGYNDPTKVMSGHPPGPPLLPPNTASVRSEWASSRSYYIHPSQATCNLAKLFCCLFQLTLWHIIFGQPQGVITHFSCHWSIITFLASPSTTFGTWLPIYVL